MSRSLPPLLIMLSLAIALAACAVPAASPSPSQTSTPPPSATPAPPHASPTQASESVVVTIQVVAETYRILLTEPDDVAVARTLLAGQPAPGIPNGRIVYGDPGVNEGYTWQIDPDDIEWADMTTEVCDGLPSDVEAHAISGDRYCPWSAEVVAVESGGVRLTPRAARSAS